MALKVFILILGKCYTIIDFDIFLQATLSNKPRAQISNSLAPM